MWDAGGKPRAFSMKKQRLINSPPPSGNAACDSRARLEHPPEWCSRTTWKKARDQFLHHMYSEIMYDLTLWYWKLI